MPTELQRKLGNDDVALGLNWSFPAAGIIECMGRGWDWVWIDGQHGQMDYRSMLQCVRAADGCGVAPVPRVAGHDYCIIGPVMDMRTAGIIVPMVNTPDEARLVVEAARFPPLGRRSYGGRRVVDLAGRQYAETANADTLLVIQIETQQAVRNAEAIAGIEGVDALFFGPDDMKLGMGMPIDTPYTESDELAAAMEYAAKAARNAGKIAGTVAGGAESLAMATSLGFRLIAGGGDVGFLRMSAAEKLRELKTT